jgi:putative acetyltransferase
MDMEIKIRASRPEDGARVMTIWRTAVDVTHDFLSAADRVEIEKMVLEFLPQASMFLAVTDTDDVVGFMLLSDAHMEALFVDPQYHGKGIGQFLVQYGLALYPTMTTDVNEQNSQAFAFYERMRFVRTGRSDTDSEGRPYPLIHLQHKGV